MSQSGRKYIHRSRTEWSRLLAEYEAGDTTQRDFCAERGLTYSNFCVCDHSMAFFRRPSSMTMVRLLFSSQETHDVKKSDEHIFYIAARTS